MSVKCAKIVYFNYGRKTVIKIFIWGGHQRRQFMFSKTELCPLNQDKNKNR